MTTQNLNVCDTVKSAFLARFEHFSNIGKNADLFITVINGKQNVNTKLLASLGYDLKSKIDLTQCSKKALGFRLKKLDNIITQDYLFNIIVLFKAFIKKPSIESMQAIIDFNNANSQKVVSVINDSISSILFDDALSFDSKMQKLPSFLTVNHFEKLNDASIKNEVIQKAIDDVTDKKIIALNNLSNTSNKDILALIGQSKDIDFLNELIALANKQILKLSKPTTRRTPTTKATTKATPATKATATPTTKATATPSPTTKATANNLALAI